LFFLKEGNYFFAGSFLTSGFAAGLASGFFAMEIASFFCNYYNIFLKSVNKNISNFFVYICQKTCNFSEGQKVAKNTFSSVFLRAFSFKKPVP
jgi:hypothetical protein